jgi:putative hydrolase of the HAD superfamily
VFSSQRTFSRDEFKAFMFAQSEPWPESIAVVRDLADSRAVEIATLNNESTELNEYRIAHFGLREIIPTFFSSCWLGVRKPTLAIYKRVLGMTQADPMRTIFVDDRPQNLAPAAGLGMNTIHFQNAAQLRKDLQSHGLLQ